MFQNKLPRYEKKIPVIIPFDEILQATNNFTTKTIGEGGFGHVYKAKLASFPNEVAIKRLNPEGRQGESEFLTEIELLSAFNHQNIICLLGYSYQDPEMILVYELAQRGSLAQLLQEKNDLPWLRRLQICLDAALGLYYIHNGKGDQHRMIHRDIKCDNILVNELWQGKISDFGLSKVVPLNSPVSHVVSNTIAGTRGYQDPQYKQTGVLKKESDVYSFGVVLLEVFCGEMTNDPMRDEDKLLASVARDWFSPEGVAQGGLQKTLDPRLADKITPNYSIYNDEISKYSLNEFVEVIENCLKVKQEERPTMGQVVKGLNEALKCQVKDMIDVLIKLDEIRSATNNFSDDCCFDTTPLYSMYKGVVRTYKGYKLAMIKRAKYDYDEDAISNHCFILFSTEHQNMLSVLGLCVEDGELIFVYEYPVYGTLDMYLGTNGDLDALTWKQLLNICIGVARGLEYLHDSEFLHGNITSNEIFLNEHWDPKLAFLSNPEEQKQVVANRLAFVSNSLYDPNYGEKGEVGPSMDVFSLGVLLLELLCGRPVNSCDDTNGHDFTSGLQAVINSLDGNNGDPRIKEQIAPDCLMKIKEIALKCVRYPPNAWPKMDYVRKELEEALCLQENHEWESKLPKDYEAVIKMAKSQVNHSNKKELYCNLYSGIHLKNGHLFSLSEQGEKRKIVPAASFMKKNRKPSKSSRFPKVANIEDLSELKLDFRIKTDYLSPKITYAVWLVFRFYDQMRRYTAGPKYVELKYRLGVRKDTSIAYFAEQGNNGWMKINLGHHIVHEADADLKVVLIGMSRYYCGKGGIDIEGIEFLPVENEGVKLTTQLIKFVSEKGMNMTNDSAISIFEKGMLQKLESYYPGTIARYGEKYFQADGHVLFRPEGLRIDNGKKFYRLRQWDGKQCQWITAREILRDSSSNENEFKWITRVGLEIAEVVSNHKIQVKCNIDTRLLSKNTVYACYLLYRFSETCKGLHCPVKVNIRLQQYKRKEKTYVYLRHPSPVNLPASINRPKVQENGFMIVEVCQINSDLACKRSHYHLNIKLVSLKGTMSGLQVCGIVINPK